MKSILSAFALMTVLGSPGLAQVRVSVNIGEPNFFGRIELGDAPMPRFINPQPLLIERGSADQPPLYLHVQPGYERHWRRHCREYDACNRPVFFVRDDWYRDSYVRYYRERHGDARGWGRDRDEHPNSQDHRDHRQDTRTREDHRDERGEEQKGPRNRDDHQSDHDHTP